MIESQTAAKRSGSGVLALYGSTIGMKVAMAVTGFESGASRCVVLEDRSQIGEARRVAAGLAAEAGLGESVRSDVGIVYTPGGRIAMAITCEELPETEYTPDNRALLLISRLSQALVEGLVASSK